MPYPYYIILSNNVKQTHIREINVTYPINFPKIIDIFSEMHYSENTKFLTNFQFFGGAIWITLVEQKHYKH